MSRPLVVLEKEAIVSSIIIAPGYCPKYVVYCGQMPATRGPALGLKSHILGRIKARPAFVWTPIDFLDIAPRAAVDKALQRLTSDKVLARLDRGLYYLPKINTLTGVTVAPGHAAVIDAVGRRDQARVLIDGLTAANDLGLTTAVPARITVLTDARLRPIRLGKQHIQFREAAPSRLYWAGRPAMRIVQALYWLQDILGPERTAIIKRLRRNIGDPSHGAELRGDLLTGLPTLPSWMQSVVRELLDLGASTRQEDRQPRAAKRMLRVRR